MQREALYLSTTAADAAPTARQGGFGIEIAEYCTAWNMDDSFDETDPQVRAALEGVARCVLHAPFNELFPCAIDRKARALAAERYRQAIALAKRYGAEKVIVHGGYNPYLYYPVWYVEQSGLFWKAFLQEDPGVEICLENVLETESGMLLDILKGVGDPRLRICLDVGHAHAYSKTPVIDWLETCAPYISHFHIHNNDGSWDTHQPLAQGSIPMRELLCRAGQLCPDATYTLELMETVPSIDWLRENGIL